MCFCYSMASPNIGIYFWNIIWAINFPKVNTAQNLKIDYQRKSNKARQRRVNLSNIIFCFFVKNKNFNYTYSDSNWAHNFVTPLVKIWNGPFKNKNILWSVKNNDNFYFSSRQFYIGTTISLSFLICLFLFYLRTDRYFTNLLKYTVVQFVWRKSFDIYLF